MNNITESSSEKYILIVEDSTADAELIKMQIGSIWPGSRVEVVDSLSKLYNKYIEQKPHLILLDLNLPDGFGPKSVEEAMSFIREVPVIVITSMGSSFTLNEAKRFGAQKVIFKDKIMTDEFKSLLKESI